MATKELSQKEKVFVEEYIRNWNGAAAAREAGYSARSAREIAYDLLTKPHIISRIKERLETMRMETNEIYARLSAQAQADISEFVEFADEPILDKDGNHVGDRQVLHVKPETFGRFGFLIRSISPIPGGGFRIELHNSQTALELLGKTYKLFKDEVVITTEDFQQLLQYLPDDYLRRVGDNGEEAGKVIQEWIVGTVIPLVSVIPPDVLARIAKGDKIKRVNVQWS